MESSVVRTAQSFELICESDFSRLRHEIEKLDFNRKTLLISGATGFFGAWLLGLCAWVHRHLEPDFFRVIAISRDPSRFLRKHPWAVGAPWLEWVVGDIRSFEFPHGDLDWVLHGATDTSANAGRDATVILDTLVGGARRILECARQGNAKRVLLVSSGAVYGSQSLDVSHQREESTAACNTLSGKSAYGEGKRVMELLGTLHADDTDAAVVSARCFAFVGAGLPLDGHFAVGNFIRDAIDRPNLTIGGDGCGRRSYLYAADLAIWLMRLLAHGQSKRAYNVGSDQDLTIAALAQCTADALAPGKPVVIQNSFSPSPVGDRYVPSIARAREELGLDVWTTLPEALIATASWDGSQQ